MRGISTIKAINIASFTELFPMKTNLEADIVNEQKSSLCLNEVDDLTNALANLLFTYLGYREDPHFLEEAAARL